MKTLDSDVHEIDNSDIHEIYCSDTKYKLVFQTLHVFSKGLTASESFVCCLYLVYPGYIPDISMTFDISHKVCDRSGCSLKTFGYLEWESELYRGILRATAAPDAIPSTC